jgi:hypothetical protein
MKRRTVSRGILVFSGAAVAVLGSASLASAVDGDPVGDLTYQGCITGETQSAENGACRPTDVTGSDGEDSGLDRLRADTVDSPDGRSLYTASVNDDAVAHFERDPTTGRLTFVDCITGQRVSGPPPVGSGACETIGTKATRGGNDTGLHDLRGVVVSPDGEWVYAASTEDDAVARFDRDPATGDLDYVDCITGETESGPGGTGACTQIPDAAHNGNNTGLDELRSVVASDGSLYTASGSDDAVARFELVSDPETDTDVLSFQKCITGETNSAPACTTIGDKATEGGMNSGLDSLVALAIGPGGGSVYAASEHDDAVARFSTANGEFTYQDCITGERQSTTPAGTRACRRAGTVNPAGDDSGLDELQSVAVSNGSLYTASQFDDAVARFNTSDFTYQDCITGETQSGPEPPEGEGSGACTAIESATDVDDSNPPDPDEGGADSGLDTLRAVAARPDGISVYAASADDDGVASFGRDLTDGGLTYQGCITGETESGPGPEPNTNACTAIESATSQGRDSGLDSPRSLVVSPPDRDEFPEDHRRSLFAGSREDSAVARFKVKLTLQE